MRAEFIDLLACPTCRGAVAMQRPAAGASVEEGGLVCVRCGGGFAIAGGIPRMVQENEDGRTAARFAYEWRHFPDLAELYEKQFLDWIAPIGRDFFPGKTVLDAGCGKGRHTLLAARFGAKRVVGLDLGQAIEIAHRNTRGVPNIDLVQGDLCQPPLVGGFDYIYCIGVLHHLARPHEGLRALSALLRAGGTVSIWVYGREGNGWIVYLVNPLRKFVTSRMPLGLVKALSWPLAVFLAAAAKLVYGPANVYAKPLTGFLFYNDYLSYIAPFDLREIHSIVFDHLLAPVAFYLKRDEVLSWFDKRQFTDVRIARHNRNSWKVTARKLEAADA